MGILMIAQGKISEKPSEAESRGLTVDKREFIRRCWHQDPTKRPGIEAVVDGWQNFCSQERWPAHPKVEDRPLARTRY